MLCPYYSRIYIKLKQLLEIRVALHQPFQFLCAGAHIYISIKARVVCIKGAKSLKKNHLLFKELEKKRKKNKKNAFFVLTSVR